MSQYANYDVDSPHYDCTRVPVGLEVILGCLTRIGIPLGEQSVLEAGCGTGNFLQALHPVLGSLVGVDFSEAMLVQARATVTGDVQMIQGSVLDLPMDDESFDAVICNQVVHHLDEGPGVGDDPATWPTNQHAGIVRFLGEAYRVLRPGGALVLNFCTKVQARDGFWWADLIPEAVERIDYRLPTIEHFHDLLTAAGFETRLAMADLQGVLQGTSYLDSRGPLKQQWRAGDSTWTLTTDAELAVAKKRVEKMHEDGTIDQYLARREELRQHVGQTTFLCGRK